MRRIFSLLTLWQEFDDWLQKNHPDYLSARQSGTTNETAPLDERKLEARYGVRTVASMRRGICWYDEFRPASVFQSQVCAFELLDFVAMLTFSKANLGQAPLTSISTIPLISGR